MIPKWVRVKNGKGDQINDEKLLPCGEKHINNDVFFIENRGKGIKINELCTDHSD